MVCLLLWQPSQVLLYYILLKQHIYGFSIDKCKDSGFYPLHQTSGLKKVKLAIISDHHIEVQHFNNLRCMLGDFTHLPRNSLVISKTTITFARIFKRQ
jgi:hypothetical protein